MRWNVVDEVEEENFPEGNGKRQVGVGPGCRARSRAVSWATIPVGDSVHLCRSNLAIRSASEQFRSQDLEASIVQAPPVRTM
jgi:hypothetical protein